MIVPGTTGVSAKLDLTFDQVAVDYDSIVDIQLQADENLHDYACVTINGIPTRAVNDYVGVNVRFIVSTGANYVHEFFGTVDFVEPVSSASGGLVNGSPFQTAKVHCYGNSYRMRGKTSKVWEHTTLDQMANKLAHRYGFSSSVIKPKRSIPRFVQESESDWEALVRYASVYGYKVTLNGTHLHIYDPLAAMARFRSFHRLSTADVDKVDSPGKVYKFEAMVGRAAVDGIHKDACVTVMDPSGRQYDLTTSKVRGTSGGKFTVRENHVVDSYAEGRAIIDAATRSAYDFQATVECLGVAGAYPGGVVDLTGYRSDLDGLWYVSSVKHSVHSGSFTSILEIKKFAEMPLSFTATQPYSKPPSSVISKGEWVSSRDSVACYA